MNIEIQSELEEDGRWLAEAPQLPGVLVYAGTREAAMLKAEILALRVIAERLEQQESAAFPVHIDLAAAA